MFSLPSVPFPATFTNCFHVLFVLLPVSTHKSESISSSATIFDSVSLALDSRTDINDQRLSTNTFCYSIIISSPCYGWVHSLPEHFWALCDRVHSFTDTPSLCIIWFIPNLTLFALVFVEPTPYQQLLVLDLGESSPYLTLLVLVLVAPQESDPTQLDIL